FKPGLFSQSQCWLALSGSPQHRPLHSPVLKANTGAAPKHSGTPPHTRALKANTWATPIHSGTRRHLPAPRVSTKDRSPHSQGLDGSVSVSVANPGSTGSHQRNEREGQNEQVPAYSMCIRAAFVVCIRARMDERGEGRGAENKRIYAPYPRR